MIYSVILVADAEMGGMGPGAMPPPPLLGGGLRGALSWGPDFFRNGGHPESVVAEIR